MPEPGERVGRVAVVTSAESWFVPHARTLCDDLVAASYDAALFHRHEDVPAGQGVVFLLSYFRIVETAFLEAHERVLAVHESDLPEGRGWAPLMWQVLEGKQEIPVVLFEVQEGVDEGDVYLRDRISLDGYELNDELRAKQARATIEICAAFLARDTVPTPTPQSGTPTRYPRRTPDDSELDPDKTLREQFNLLRTVHNEEYPAFFVLDGRRYNIRIERDAD